MRVSVVVATSNRSGKLRNLLDSLCCSETAANVEWDLWVVDSHSTDETRAVVESYVDKLPRRLHYLYEAGPGKSRAVNLGIRQSNGEIVLFTDDDCIPGPNWIANVAREFSSRPELGVVGGRIELYDRQDYPIATRHSTERRVLQSSADVFYFIGGGNMALRREILDLIGGLDPELGPGAKSPAAEDVDLVYRASRMGFPIEYVPDILVYHNHGRRSDLSVQSLKKNYVMGRGAFYAKHILRGDLFALKMAYWEVNSLLRDAIKKIFARKGIREERHFLWFLLLGATKRLMP